MAIVAWSQDLESCDERVDAHNQSLLSVLEELFASAAPCPGQAEICRKIEQAVCLLTSSFGQQEAVMSAVVYDARRGHKNEHRALLCELQSMKRTFECGRYDTAAVFDRLAGWMVEHIQRWDKPLGQHLRCDRLAPSADERRLQSRLAAHRTAVTWTGS